MKNYAFKELAPYAALRAILAFEQIPFERGVGPGVLTVSVEEKWIIEVEQAITNWKHALPLIAVEVFK